jgi:uncharacterized protein
MRVTKKEIHDRNQIRDILNCCPVGRLATLGKDGYPLIKPLNYVYFRERIYFHSAKVGEKIDDILRDPRVCFEVDIPLRYVEGDANPCSASYRYRSVIARGKARIVEDPNEILESLSALMKKYQPEGSYGEFLQEKLALTAVIRIDLHDITGKEDVR